MARYDVYPNPGQNPQVPFLLDVQSDLLSVLDTRVVVPLRRLDSYPAGALPKHLSPVFEVVGIACFMETSKLAAVPLRILKSPVASLAAQHPDITAALDFLFHGY